MTPVLQNRNEYETATLKKEKLHLGLIGLAAMGYNLAYNLLYSGYTVSLYNRSDDKTNSIKEEYSRILLEKKDQEQFLGKFIFCYTLEHFVQSIPEPRPIFMIVQATAVKQVISNILPLISETDMICDFANSIPEHSVAHAKMISQFFQLDGEHSAKFLGIGISGGTTGARKNGALMISGHLETFNYLKGVFSSLTSSYEYFGEGYATGHFIKYLHNGIEYALMSVIAEFNEISCALERIYGNKKDDSKKHTSGMLSDINEHLDTYLLTILKKVTENDAFPRIRNVLQMKGSGQWVYNTFGGRVNISLIGNAVEQRVTQYCDTGSSRGHSVVEETSNSGSYTGERRGPQEFKRIFKNAFLYCLRACFLQGIDVILHDKEIVKDTSHKNVVRKSLNVWRNGCIISGGIIDIVKDFYFKESGLDEYHKIDEDTVEKDLKEIVLFAINHDIPSQQSVTILNDLKRRSSQDNQIRILAGMRDLFGMHGVDIDGRWVNIDW